MTHQSTGVKREFLAPYLTVRVVGIHDCLCMHIVSLIIGLAAIACGRTGSGSPVLPIAPHLKVQTGRDYVRGVIRLA